MDKINIAVITIKIIWESKNSIELFSNSLRSNENNFIYFLKQLGNKGKRKFSASRAVFLCT